MKIKILFKILSLIIICYAGVFSPAFAGEKDIQKKIEQLETELMMIKEEMGDADSTLTNTISISGYTDVEYISSSQDDVEPGFRLHHLSLFFQKNISEKWRFFSEIEFEDAPFFEFEKKGDKDSTANGDTSGKIFVEAVNSDYLWKQYANFRIGRFFTPAGIWSIDHYPPFVTTQERPMHIREIFPQLVDGAMFYGTYPAGNIFLNYDLYLGNGEGNTGHNDNNSDKVVGLKTDVKFPLLKLFEIGGTLYNDRLNDRTKKFVFGLHTKIREAGFTLQTEYADGAYDLKDDAATDYHSIGYYGQLSYALRSFTLGFRHDFYDQNTEQDGNERRNSFFVNYHYRHDIVIKVEHHLNDHEDSGTVDDTKTIVSLGIYLGS